MARFGRAYPVQRIYAPPFIPPVLYDATGAGQSAASGNLSWSHTIGTGATAVLVGLTGAGTSPTAKVGATSMTSLATIVVATGIRIRVFGLLNPPTGTQTITVTTPGNTSGANSVSYNNVTSFGTGVTASGTGTSASQTVSSGARQMVFQMFGSDGAVLGDNFTLYNKTQRWNDDVNEFPIVIGDAAGAASVNFTATAPGAANWAGIAVPLIH